MSNTAHKEWLEFIKDKDDLKKATDDWLAHLVGCDDCNYDKDCWACQIGGETRLEHICGCPVIKGPGYQLGEIYRKELAKVLFEFNKMRKERRKQK